MTSKIKEGFFAITESITASNLTGNEKVVSSFIASHNRQGNECFASNEYIGWLITLNTRSGSAIIKSLKDKGVIETIITDSVRGSDRVLKFIGIPKAMARGKFESAEKKIAVMSEVRKMANKKKAIVEAMVEYDLGTKEQAQDALDKYDAAYELFKNDSHVKIQEAPNDMIIMKIMQT